MPDQALNHFLDLIGIFDYGRSYCHALTGKVPKIGWSIDAFGASAYMSRLYAEMGYHTQIHNRLPYNMKSELKRTDAMSFVWKGERPEWDMVTSFTHGHYTQPPPILIDPFDLKNPEFRLLHVAYDHHLLYEDIAGDFQGKHVMIPTGEDFYFRNFSKDYINVKAKYNVHKSNSKSIFAHSTYTITNLQTYIKAKADEIKGTLPQIGPIDMVPLVDNWRYETEAFWTGYFGIKPTLKYCARKFGTLLRSVYHLLAI